MQEAKMHMLWYMSGPSHQDRIRNDYMTWSFAVAYIKSKTRKHRLYYFSHVMRRGEENLVWTTLRLRIESRGGRGRPKVVDPTLPPVGYIKVGLKQLDMHYQTMEQNRKSTFTKMHD